MTKKEFLNEVVYPKAQEVADAGYYSKVGYAFGITIRTWNDENEDHIIDWYEEYDENGVVMGIMVEDEMFISKEYRMFYMD